MNNLVLLLPLIILQLILVVAALVDLTKRENVAGGNKVAWALAIIFFGTIGPIAYFIFGRKEKNDEAAE